MWPHCPPDPGQRASRTDGPMSAHAVGLLPKPVACVYTLFAMSTQKRLDRLECREIADTCTFFSVRRASRVVGKIFDEALRPAGLRATQFSLLVGLGMVESATVTRMADSLALDRTSLTRNLAPL